MGTTPNLYEGRVGHDVSEGHCSCGAYHSAAEGIKIGTKTVLVQTDGVNRLIEWDAEDPTKARVIAFEAEHKIGE